MNNTIRKQMDPYWNNVKFVLILLVVVGHFSEGFYEHSRTLVSLWEVIYLFHMPAFILVSGIFCGKIIRAEPFKIDRVISYLIFFVFISLTYNIECQFGFGWERDWHLLIAQGPQWYMLVIAMDMLVTHIIKDIRPVMVFSCSLLIALLAGYDDSIGDFLALSRWIVSYPFFYCGFCLGKDRLKYRISTIRSRHITIILSIVFFITLFLFIHYHQEDYINISGLCTMRNSYYALGIPVALGGLARLLFYLLTAIAIIALLVLIPDRRFGYCTDIGSRTLQIYICHGYIIRWAQYIELNFILKHTFGVLWPLVLLLLAVVCAFILSVPVIEKPFKAVMRINFSRLYSHHNN